MRAQRRAPARPRGERRPAGWVYANGRLFAEERESLFQESWQFAGHCARLARPGDFFGVDLGNERALILRDGAGEVRAFRNSCSEAPHILVAAPAGRLELIQCTVHGLQFELDGRRRGTRGAADLTALEVRLIGDLILVRAAQRRRAHAVAADPWTDFVPPPGSRPMGGLRDVGVGADWKLVIEQWLELAARAQISPADANGWSARRYRRLVGAAAEIHSEPRFFAPNHLIEVRGDGFTIRQALPVGPGRSVLRQHDFTLCEAQAPAQAAAYLASRLNPYMRRTAITVAESTQQGIVAFGHAAAEGVRAAPAVAQFRRQLLAQLPMMALARPPNDP